MKYLITGGSGFLGTNLIEKLIDVPDCVLLSLDIVSPKIERHNKIWKQIDICDTEMLLNVVVDFSPDYVIHLGARTDLRGKILKDYDANMKGVSNLLDALEKVRNLKRVIFASSMYVCEPGYLPKDFEDYAPHTLYGESKVETERRIKARKAKYIWSIIRPTSIWGPWFDEPYNKFFHTVLNHMYFHMGKRACRKTYGYVGNVIYQIESILEADADNVNHKIFYLGDYEPYSITDWANEIARLENIKIPEVPYICFQIMGYLGDIFKKLGISFPMTSFRLHNMTTDNVHNLNPIKEIVPNLPFSRINGTKITLDWIHKNE